MAEDELDRVTRIAPVTQVQKGGKVQHVFMDNPQAAIIKHYSRPFLDEELRKKYPAITIVLDNRALGCEDEWDTIQINNRLKMINLCYQLNCSDQAMELALYTVGEIQGYRADNGFERKCQITTHTIEALRTEALQYKKPGFFSTLVGGKKKQENQMMNLPMRAGGQQ